MRVRGASCKSGSGRPRRHRDGGSAGRTAAGRGRAGAARRRARTATGEPELHRGVGARPGRTRAARAAEGLDAAQAERHAAEHALRESRLALSLRSRAPTRRAGRWELNSPGGRPGDQAASGKRGPVAAGQPILDIGDASAFEAVIDVLSGDARACTPGAPVHCRSAAARRPRSASVSRIEPVAFTKVSALGIEEQRVNVLADFRPRSRAAARRRLSRRCPADGVGARWRAVASGGGPAARRRAMGRLRRRRRPPARGVASNCAIATPIGPGSRAASRPARTSWSTPRPSSPTASASRSARRVQAAEPGDGVPALRRQCTVAPQADLS